MFERIWQAGLQEHDELEGIAWEWQSMDGVMRHPPLSVEPRPAPIPPIAASGEPSAGSPSDGRGMPLAVVVDGANRTDMKLAEASLNGIMIARPMPTKEQPQQLCLDAGYDYEAVYETVRAQHYEPHIRPNLHNRAQVTSTPEPEKETSSNLESTKQPRSFVVERLHSWLNRSRRLLVR